MRDGDDDIAAALPKAPPPSPVRRTAAIEEAMRRFDGIEATPPAERQRSASRWTALRRPQVAGLVSIALVAMVGMPVAWLAIDRESTPNMTEVGSHIAEGARQGTTRTPVETTAQSQEPPLQPAGPQAVLPRSSAPGSPSETSRRDNAQPVALEASPAPIIAATPISIDGNRQSSAAGKTAAGDKAKDVVVTGTQIRGVAPTGTNLTVTSKEDIEATGQSSVEQLLATVPGFSNFNQLPNNAGAAAKGAASPSKTNPRAALASPAARTAPAPPPPPPPSPVASALLQRDAGTPGAVGVAGQSARAASTRGDWNACTVNDPGRNFGDCKTLVDPGAAGAPGRAAAYLADGLSHAWQGDFTGAIAAFDAAIGISPRLAFAYLNRGLAWQHRGDLDHALADLNQAVRYDPNGARGYFSRSVVLRQRGDARRAAADETRAVALDSRYEALIK